MLVPMFKSKGRETARSQAEDICGKLIALQTDKSYGEKKITKAVLALESSTESQQLVSHASKTSAELIRSVLERDGYRLSDHQLNAGVSAALLSADPLATAKRQLVDNTGQAIVTNPGVSPHEMTREYGLESYEESDFRQMQRMSVTYNILASSQDAVGNAWFPPILMDARVTGLETEISITNVFNDFMRSTSGTLAEFNRRNILRGFVDPNITRNRLTELFPVYRDTGKGASAHNFVDISKAPLEKVHLGAGVNVETGWLKVGEKFDLLGISQRDEMLANGQADFTDTLSPVIRLKQILIQFGEDFIPFDVFELRDSLLLGSLTGHTRKTILTFNNDSLVLTDDAVDVQGNDLKTLASLKGLNVRFTISMTGNITTDSATSIINADNVEFMNATDKNGKLVPDAQAQAIADLIDEGKIVGYKLDARFDNWNLRNLGLLVESQTFRTIVNVPYLSPISSVATTYDRENDDQAALGELVSVANITSTHAAIEKILRSAEYMRKYRAIPDRDGNYPGFLGIGSYYVLPYWFSEKVRFTDFVDGTNSVNRFDDIRAAWLGRIFTHGMKAMLQSEYLAAGRKITGNEKFRPKLIVATDPFIAAYLMNGESNLHKFPDFDIEINSSLSNLIEGRIYMSFSTVGQDASITKMCPLTYGAYAYSPELVSKLQKSWNGQVSNALTVTPRWLHIWNLPILSEIIVTDMESASEKLPINTRVVQ